MLCPLFCPRICRLLDREEGKVGKPREREGSLDEFDASRMLDRPPEPTGTAEAANYQLNKLTEATTPPVPSTEPPDTGVRNVLFLVASAINLW